MAAPASPQHSDTDSALLRASRAFLARQTLTYQNVRNPLFDEQLAKQLDELVQIFAAQEQVSAQDRERARIAAYLYPMRFRQQPGSSREQWWHDSARALRQAAATPEQLQAIKECLDEANHYRTPQAAAQLLHDAALCLYLNEAPIPWASLRRLEQSLSAPLDREQEAQLYFQELLAIRYATVAGQQYWQPKVLAALSEQKRRLDKLRRREPDAATSSETAFAQLETDTPLRAAQTFFRAVYRNHINLSAIADNKANIMISVNSILISVLITFLSYRNIAETQPMVLVPVILFLIVGLTSLVFAVLSARPKVTQLNDAQTALAVRKRNLAFFGNFVTLSLEDFEEAMDEVLSDGALLYGNMVRDLYYLGKVLDKKYRYLSFSYNIFMVGLIVTVALFLFTFFYR
ncbi:MAG: hypothetical protein D6772_01230 [Bacteroidetes bacterium]|nr:MAG: hypothetical protein D6772_01230 [Bacteroidota bacterium]